MQPARLVKVTVAGLILAASACYDDSVYADLQRLTSSRESSSTTDADAAGGTTQASTTSADTTGGAMDSLTGDSADGSSTGGEGQTGGDADPSVSLSVNPEILYQAGFVTLAVSYEGSPEKLELWDAVDDQHPQHTWTPGEPPPPYLITRGELRYLTVRAVYGDGEVGMSDVATVALQFPSPGTTLWEKSVEQGSEAQGRAVSSDYIKGELSVVAGFDVDNGARVGRFSAVGEPGLYAPPATAVSATTGVAIMTDGSVLATGVDLIEGQPRPWLASIEPYTGEVTILSTGQLGETATGIAVDHELGRVYVSGYTKPKGAAAADAMIWAKEISGTDLWNRRWERPVEDDDDLGQANDLGLAVAVLDNHDPVLVGETRLLPKNPENGLQHWAFVHRFDSSGGYSPKSKSWMSSEVFNAAGAYAVARDDDNGLLVAGWTSQDAKASRQATILAFDPLLTEAESHHFGPAGFWNAKGVARLETGDVVYVTDADVEDEGRHDFEVRAIDTLSFGTASWTKVIAGAEGARAAGLTVSPEGHIVVIGTSIDKDGTSMTLRGLHP